MNGSCAHRRKMAGESPAYTQLQSCSFCRPIRVRLTLALARREVYIAGVRSSRNESGAFVFTGNLKENLRECEMQRNNRDQLEASDWIRKGASRWISGGKDGFSSSV